MTGRGALHHVEIWVEDLDEANASWVWLLERLGYTLGDTWPEGASWRRGATYLVFEAGPDRRPGRHDRRRAGLNHLAFHAGSPAEVDQLTVEATSRGWSLLFPEAHPHAGGPAHYAAYLENRAGFEVELVATSTP
ncbi:VOC family protein [Actinotalea sp. C106]|uniref:VOC family protein n=1 Tax=Actinotalea sp. C106 TaxID=2908644 RepID=UPI002029935E|nr:VOC family protein [Actinotalea sp. C106]